MEDVIAELRKDALLSVFLSSDCNVSAIASEIIAKDAIATDPLTTTRNQRSLSLSSANESISSQSERFIQRINDAVHRIDHVITEHINQHHTSLLDQVGSVDGLEMEVAAIHSSVQHVKQAVYELESTVRQQHDHLQRDLHTHRNVEKCSELVQRLLRFHQLSERVIDASRMNHSTSINQELVMIAIAIREIDTLVVEEAFEDLSVVRQRLPTIRKISATIQRDVRTFLKSSVIRLSQADVGEALEILYYLGSLKDTVQVTVNEVIQDVASQCNSLFSEELLIGTTTGANETMVQKSDVWKAIQDVFECVRIHALQVWNLQRVLGKMVDASVPSKTYLDLVIEQDEPRLFTTFWEMSTAILCELFSSTLSYRTTIKTALIGSYPRMREEANRILNDLHATSTTRSKEEDGTSIASTPSERQLLLDAMAPLGDAYIERSFRRLSNPIQMMFPQSSNFHPSPPSRSDMQTLGRTIALEIEQVGNDMYLIEQISEQIRKAVILFCDQATKIMNTGKSITTILPTWNRSATQAHNVVLLNALHQLDELIEELKPRIKPLTMASCHQQIQDLEFTILGQYLQALVIVLEGILAKMHDESFGDRIASTGGSRYMTEFCTVFNVMIEDHVRRLPTAPCVHQSIQAFITRLLSVFIRHASLLRPLEEQGKLKLANDMAQLELRLEEVLPLKTLGSPYEELRAFRHLMFLDSTSILRDPMVDKIRPSNVWHHLISRAPVELQLPHQMKRWSASKYIDWIETIVGGDIKTPLGYPCLNNPKLSILAEKEAWKEITLCLDAYIQRVSALPGVEISSMYELLQESGALLLAGYELTIFR